jgi:hypothetical protein
MKVQWMAGPGISLQCSTPFTAGNKILHFKGALISFFQGSLETWEQFTAEFALGSKISQLSVAEQGDAFMETMNDHNEGALGAFQIAMHHAHSLTLSQYNAQAMYKYNGTWDFIRYGLNDNNRRCLHRVACLEDSSGLE